MASSTRRETVNALLAVLRYDPRLTAAVVATSLAAAALEGVGLGFLLPIIDSASGGVTTGGSAGTLYQAFEAAYAAVGVPFTLASLVAGVAAVFVVRQAAGFLGSWLGARLGASYVRDLKTETFGRVLAARVDAVEERGRDDLVNAVVTQANYPVQVLSTAVSLLQQVLVTLAYLAVAAYVAPGLTVLAVVVLGGVTAVVRFVVAPAYTAGEALAAANERVQATATLGVHGHRTVKLATAADDIADRFRASVNDAADASVTLQRNGALLGHVQNLANALVVFGLLSLALSTSALSLGAAGLFLFAMFRVGPQASAIHARLYSVAGTLPHVVRAHDLLAALDADAEPTDGSPILTPVTEVGFDDVSFAYNGAPALDGVSWRARVGEFVAFVGPSGAGKSTVVSLLAGFRDPDAGEVRVDGDSLDTLAVDTWRDRLAVVQQEPFLHDGTLRENVALGCPDADRAARERAYRVAAVDEFLTNLPDGEDTTLGDDGVKLSGGQRQRVAIARALLRDPEVLVLDEATSDLDTVTEARVHDALTALDDTTTIAVAHRLSTVRRADRIYAIEDGRVREAGTHDELLARDGTYAALYDAATAGE